MSIWASIVDSFRPIPAPEPSRDAAPRPPRALGGQRARVSWDEEVPIVASALGLYAPLSPDTRWRDMELDDRTLDRISVHELVELLADVSPEISGALWTFLRMGNPGYTVEVLRRPGGPRAPQASQDALAAFLAQLGELYGDVNIVLGRLFIAAFLRGAVFGELVLAEDGRTPVDIATPDPATLRYSRTTDPVRGQIWQVGQIHGGRFVRLEGPRFVYLPIDPLPGQVRGRSPANPALFPTLFSLAMLHDVRRVVQQQGYPRIDLEVQLERLAGAMPADAAPGTEAYQTWINEVVAQVAAMYGELEPDDAYVHTDAVKVNKAQGAVDASSLGAIAPLMAILERQAVRALKTMPLLLGITDGVSEANANRQFDIYLAGIRSLQHLVERAMERLLTAALTAQGVAGVVRLRFAELQALQRMRDAQIAEIEIRNARARYDNGWISQDQAAQAGAGVERADAPAPRDAAAPPVDAQAAGQARGQGELLELPIWLSEGATHAD